jgi:hypothetical protein
MILFTYLCSKICLLLNTPAPVGTTLSCRRNSCRFEAGVPENKFNFCAHVGHIQDEGLYTRYRSVSGVTELSSTFGTSKFPICKYGLQAFICSSYFQLIYT